jgi:hypothetical protein
VAQGVGVGIRSDPTPPPPNSPIPTDPVEPISRHRPTVQIALVKYNGRVAAKDHLHGEQLSMFLPARVLVNEVSSGETPNYEPIAKSDLYDQKHYENKKEGLQQSIAQEGIRRPVVLALEKYVKPYLIDGHHRAVAANELDPNYEVPVQYFDMNKKDRNVFD